MKQFRLVDNILGWLAFAIAAFVYCSTIEPTASFWDCPEFITPTCSHSSPAIRRKWRAWSTQ